MPWPEGMTLQHWWKSAIFDLFVSNNVFIPKISPIKFLEVPVLIGLVNVSLWLRKKWYGGSGGVCGYGNL